MTTYTAQEAADEIGISKIALLKAMRELKLIAHLPNNGGHSVAHEGRALGITKSCVTKTLPTGEQEYFIIHLNPDNFAEIRIRVENHLAHKAAA